MKKSLTFLCLIVCFSSSANVICKGKIKRIYKWDYFETISILMDNEGARWISMPTKSDEAMALMAFASGKSITLNWSDASKVTTCNEGWANNRKLKGWWSVDY